MTFDVLDPSTLLQGNQTEHGIYWAVIEKQPAITCYWGPYATEAAAQSLVQERQGRRGTGFGSFFGQERLKVIQLYQI